MAHDDWRVRVELSDESGAEDFLDRLGLRQSEADELSDELRAHRLAVSPVPERPSARAPAV